MRKLGHVQYVIVPLAAGMRAEKSLIVGSSIPGLLKRHVHMPARAHIHVIPRPYTAGDSPVRLLQRNMDQNWLPCESWLQHWKENLHRWPRRSSTPRYIVVPAINLKQRHALRRVVDESVLQIVLVMVSKSLRQQLAWIASASRSGLYLRRTCTRSVKAVDRISWITLGVIVAIRSHNSHLC